MAELVGERTKLSLKYRSNVDPDNIGRYLGPDTWGAYLQIVGVEGNLAYLKGVVTTRG